MEKLELKHLAPYLPYGLKMMHYNKSKILNGGQGSSTNWIGITHSIHNQIKPILRPLSDLTKVNVFGGLRFEPMFWFKDDDDGAEKIDLLNRFMIGKISYSELSYEQIERLFAWHFDVFGLIEKGLAIDINTIK